VERGAVAAAPVGGERAGRKTLARWAPLAASALAAAAYVVAEPHTADLAAAVYRADLGFETFNEKWYGGHHTPGYSVLVPPLAWLLGPWLVAALATVAAVELFRRLLDNPWATGFFAANAVLSLYAGRVPFAVGVAVGLGALLAERKGHPRWAIALGLLTPLASPVAGVFLAFGALVWRKWWLAVAGLAPAVALAVAFPTGGSFPFEAGSFWPALAFALLTAALAPKGMVRTGALLYAVALVAAFVLPTPMGGNAVRLGMLFLGPALVLVAPRHAAVLAVPLLVWTAIPAVRDLDAAAGDPSTRASYWTPVARLPGPVEVVFTRNHWEAAHVAKHTPIARGWERQLDRERNALFYEGRLTPERYRRWLRSKGVRYVVLPDAELDYSARAEARLVARILREVRRTRHLKVYEAPG
jgi:hypothetical protein